MSSYRPPSARMRQIRSKAKRRPEVPSGVDAAIKAAVAKQAAGEEVAAEIRIPVGALDAVVKPGPDKKYGTADDQVTIEAHQDDGLHDHEEEEEAVEAEPLVEAEVVKAPEPEYGMDLKKASLMAIADDYGVELADGDTKSEIIEKLDAYFK